MAENSSNTIMPVMMQILITTTVLSAVKTAQPAWMAVEIVLLVSQHMLLTFQHQEFANAIPTKHPLRLVVSLHLVTELYALHGLTVDMLDGILAITFVEIALSTPLTVLIGSELRQSATTKACIWTSGPTTQQPTSELTHIPTELVAALRISIWLLTSPVANANPTVLPALKALEPALSAPPVSSLCLMEAADATEISS